MIFKRRIYAEMLEWKKCNGKYALLIKGARRVGKSTIALEFARNEYKTHIAIDFSCCPPEVSALFQNVYDLDYVFTRLQLHYKVSLIPRQSVIVFDEVQMCPQARQAIKHLVADGRFDYIETGSLISIKQNVKDIVIPSEEHRICLHPMDYEEFRWALGDEASVPLLQKAFAHRRRMGDDTNRMLMRDFRLYMLVGGMPQAVSEYITTKDLGRVDGVKRKIIELYEDDLNKIDGTGNAARLFHGVPSALTSNAARYVISAQTNGARVYRWKETIERLRESMVVNVAYHVSDPNAGMALHRVDDRFKMFVEDTGLFITLEFWEKRFIENRIYVKLLSDKLSADLGYVYENIVAQMLTASGHELYYYTFPTPTGNHNYEVDFLIADGDKVSPIEVKSSGYKTHASLDAFGRKFSQRVRQRYMVYTKDLGRDDDVLYLPAYMAMFL